MTRVARPSRSFSARAFTLLELMLAMAIASAVLVAGFMLFITFERSDRVLDVRFVQSSDLENVRVVMQRAFSSIVVTDRASLNVRAQTTGNAKDQTQAAVAEATDRGTGDAKGGDAKSGSASKKPKPPPRIILEPAPPTRVEHPPDVAGKHLTQPQRLEMVLVAAPISTGARAEPTPIPTRTKFDRGKGKNRDTPGAGASPRDAASRDRSAVRDSSRADGDTPATGSGSTPRDRSGGTPRAGSKSPRRGQDGMPGAPGATRDATPAGAGDQESLADTIVRAVRGAFELRPQTSPTRTLAAPRSARPAFELYWVPLPPRLLPDEQGDEQTGPVREVLQPSGTPVLIASNIAFMQWRVFDDRVRKTQYEATFWQDLPAYVEVEVETIDGLTGNWLFEVDSLTGAEVADDQPASTQLPSEGAQQRETDGSRPVPPSRMPITPKGGKGGGA